MKKVLVLLLVAVVAVCMVFAAGCTTTPDNPAPVPTSAAATPAGTTAVPPSTDSTVLGSDVTGTWYNCLMATGEECDYYRMEIGANGKTKVSEWLIERGESGETPQGEFEDGTTTLTADGKYLIAYSGNGKQYQYTFELSDDKRKLSAVTSNGTEVNYFRSKTEAGIFIKK